MAEVLGNAGAARRTVDRREQGTLSEWQRTMVGLLRHQVLLLAMKDGRAPLPVSTALLRGLQKYGFLDHAYAMGSIARRLLFVGDARILLAELRRRSTAGATEEEKNSRDLEIEGEEHLQFQDVLK